MLASKGNAWGNVQGPKATKFQDIVNDQSESHHGMDSESIHFQRLVEDEDYQLALRIQNEEIESCSDATVTDQKLAEIMQRIENEEEAEVLTKNLNSGEDKYSKVKLQSRSLQGEAENMSRALPVTSSEFSTAMKLESTLQHSSRDVQSIFKHDALLQGLSNSASLSELDGVGDLFGSKLLVNNSVANSLKTFVHKNEDRQSQMKFNKSKKATALAATPLKPTAKVSSHAINTANKMSLHELENQRVPAGEDDVPSVTGEDEDEEQQTLNAMAVSGAGTGTEAEQKDTGSDDIVIV